MTILSKLPSSSTTKTPYTFFIEYFNPDGEEKELFNSKHSFQRNIVWGTKSKFKNFIESIFFGIVPSPIIATIDGKQKQKQKHKNHNYNTKIHNNKIFVKSFKMKNKLKYFYRR